MDLKKMKRLIAAAFAAAVLMMVAATPATAETTGENGAAGGSGEDILRIGWAQDPQTLNPFIGLDEESYTVWAINWDLLVNFSTEDLSPSPGIAESWEVSEDRKTVTFKLDPDRNWSDGTPVTSKDVKWSLDTLGSEGDLFTSYTNNVTSITTPDDETVVIKTSRPDARIVGGLFIYILPEHIWGNVPLKELTTTYQPRLPMVGTGPFIVTEFERGRIIRMEQNPEFTGGTPNFAQVQFVKYGTQDAVERALQLGEIDMVPEVQAATYERLDGQENIDTVDSPSPAFTQLAFNLCPAELCPDANFNPAIQDLDVRKAIAYSVDRDRINEIANRGTSFVANGYLPTFYESFHEEPDEIYAFDPEKANQVLDDTGWTREGDGIRTKDGEELSFNLVVRSESPSNIQAAKLISEMTREVGIEYNVEVVSVDKLTELTIRSVDGKPAPDFDSFIWGWGGDPYDPSFLLSLMTTDEIGGSSDSFFSNEEYDGLFTEQAGIFDVEERKQLISRMNNILQEEVAYLVLTEDPNLQAYRTDRIANFEPACPAETGDIICEQAGYGPLLTLEPASGASSSDSEGGNGAIIAIIAIVLIAGAGFFILRARRRRDSEPVEMEE
jgi:peptide/nickel transport system substrate-binding protein